MVKNLVTEGTAVHTAYDLLKEIEETTINNYDGIHPMATDIGNWCSWYEQENKVMSNTKYVGE